MEEPTRRASISAGGTAALPPTETASIKVFCRLRQQNQLEKKEGATKCSTVLDGRTMYLRNERCDVDEIRCTFDRVFDTQSTQEQVYEHTAKLLVQDFLQGYNCTIFAYGQTGSGKTHTILGPKDGVLGKLEDEGIIARVVRDLFHAVDATTASTKDTKIELTASFVEIYMEQIRDLLGGTAMPVGGLKIRENAQRGVYIEDMSHVPCANDSAMLEVVKTGTLNRSVSSTRMNKDSSRSHCILMINATRKELHGTVVKKSTMYIVDLAGSEFVNKTNASGKVLQEAKAINKSLAALSNVIKALVEGKKHVPYRDSKLTRLLQDSLGGSAKTCLILAASCSSYNMSETISTLRFGLRAKEIKNPVALKHNDSSMSAGGGIFKELYQQAMEDIEEKTKKIDELQRLLALAYEATAMAEATRARADVPVDQQDAMTQGKDEVICEPVEMDDVDCESITFVEDEKEEERLDHEEPTDEEMQELMDARETFFSELECSNQRLREENLRLFNVLEALDSQLDQIIIKTNASGWPYLSLTKPSSLETETLRDHVVTLKMWIQSESWRQLNDLSTIELEEPAEGQSSGEDSQSSARPVPSAGAVASSEAIPGRGSAPCASTSGDASPTCIHRADAEAMSRQIVELKLQLHYLNESTKQSLDGEQYAIVLENAKLKTRIEQLEFQANLGNARCNQLEMKNRAWETRLNNQETHIGCLQNSLHEYQGLFKQQIIMSQEKCRLLSDELEFYKKISKHSGMFATTDGNGGDHNVHGSPSPSPTRSYSLPRTPSPHKSVSTRSPTVPRSAASPTNPFSRLKSVGAFYRPLLDGDSEATSDPTTSLAVKAQRMLIKPETPALPPAEEPRSP